MRAATLEVVGFPYVRAGWVAAQPVAHDVRIQNELFAFELLNLPQVGGAAAVPSASFRKADSG